MNRTMLSRVANAIYWMSRYAERAENAARFVDVNLQLTLDRSVGLEPQWRPLIDVSGDLEAYEQRRDNFDRDTVLEFLTLDADNPNSILSSVAVARENARTVRETITAEMWEQINSLYHLMRRSTPADLDHLFFQRIKRSAMLFAAIADNSQSRGLAWSFGHLGRMIERADKTSRILDVKYYLLLPSAEDVGTNVDTIQWRALLHSTDALEMYRQQHGTIAPGRVAGFLMLDRAFPRSMAFCLDRAGRCLDDLATGDRRHATARLRRQHGRLQSELRYHTIDEIITGGLHEYIDSFQQRLNAIDDAVHDAFFRPINAEPTDAAGNPDAAPQLQA